MSKVLWKRGDFIWGIPPFKRACTELAEVGLGGFLNMGKYFKDYDSDLRELSKELRKISTPGEKVIWNRLKGKRIKGYGFNRQKPIGKYILDYILKYELNPPSPLWKGGGWKVKINYIYCK